MSASFESSAQAKLFGSQATTAEKKMRVFGSPERGSQILFFLGENTGGRSLQDAAFADLAKTYRIARLNAPLPSVTEVLAEADRLEPELSELGTKRTTIVAYREGTPLAQALGALSAEVVRRIVLIDPQARVSPSTRDRTIDKVEMFLPLGLPFRALNNNFDSRPLLHRVRCPVLVVDSPHADQYHREQAHYIAKKLPNAWHEKLETPVFLGERGLSEEFSRRLEEFLQVPAKRPQKNLSSE